MSPLPEKPATAGVSKGDGNVARLIRTGRPEDVAQVALMLASAESSLVHGAIVPVDSSASAY